jgi:hypothetical protein
MHQQFLCRLKKGGTMSSYNDQLLDIVEQYRRAGNAWPATKRQIARWAIDNGLWHPHASALLDQFARELGRAMREEFFTDPQGRSVRAKHVARIKSEGGKQESFWGDMRDGSKPFMEIALQQRRQQIVGDCSQLKIDMDSFNQNYNSEEPIELEFDFTKDVQELELQNLSKLN